MKRLPCLALIAVAFAGGLLSTCKIWGDRDNPVDSGAGDYQGVPTVGSASEIELCSPADGGKLKGPEVTVSAVLGAKAYEVRVATSVSALDSAACASSTSNVIDLGTLSIADTTSYYWQARAVGSDGNWGPWSATSSFTTAWTAKAEAPTFVPSGGTYTSDQKVLLSCTTTDATIYFTTDGTTPTTSSTPYTGAISVAGNGTAETIKAIIEATGFLTSNVGSASYTIAYPTTATPTFSPAGGTYTTNQSVTISCTTGGAAIYYTTDGSTPTTASTTYTGAISVSDNGTTKTIKAIATAPGYSTSNVGSASYTIAYPTAAMPTFSPVAGTYAANQSVTISCTTSGATIYYTIDGTTPTTSSTKYTGAISVAGNGTTEKIEAVAISATTSLSAVGSASYTIAYQTVATPTFSPAGGTYTADQTVTISCLTSGATIYYTTDESTPPTSSTKYTSAISVAGNGTSETIKAIATATGYTTSSVGSASYTISYPTAATPSFSPTGGTYTADQIVTISCTTNGATIYYTIDGTTPTTSSTKYMGSAISLAGNGTAETIKAIATATDYLTSSVGTASYTIAYPTAATPTFSPAGGTYTSDQTVTISCTTSKATIFYTTNGSVPTTSSMKYTGAISISGNGTTQKLQAIATATGYSNSDIGSASYTIAYPIVATPTFSPPGGTYTSDHNVTISCATSGASIYYTTDGTTPTTASTKYTSPVTVTVNPPTTLKAIAAAPGYTTSAIGSAVYFYSSLSSLSMVGVAGGTFYNGTSNVTISSFYMSATDITQAQYLAITGVNPSYFTGDTSRPVEKVTWYDAVEFCNKLSEHDGLADVYTITGRTPSSGYPITSATVTMDRTKSGYRLPTEMEWEWAAMGGMSDCIASDFSGGVNEYGYLKGYAGSSETGGGQANLGQYAWYDGNSGSTTQPVGTKAANELGLYDMSGNVWQWCWDWYGDYPSGAQTDPTGPSSGSYRVDRGGSWGRDAGGCAVSYRSGYYPDYVYDDIGFRVVSR